MLTRGGTDKMIIESQESSFSGVEFGIGRLENIEKRVPGEMGMETFLENSFS